MKQYMISSIIALATVAINLTACSDDTSVKEPDRLSSTATYYNSVDPSKQDIYYKPYVGYVGDPMPFYDPVAGDFKVMYLQDYRPNHPYRYHPIWAVSTKDASSYTSLGELISCGAESELDAAIGTGSTIYENGTYYTFYTAHSPNKSLTGGITEAVMLATSKDFKTWEKDRRLLITGGDRYSNVDFRDPFVFKDDNGGFHMLVSTLENGKGTIVEYTSADLLDWSCKGPFMTMMWDRFYECPDVFKMGDWWYLVYSEKHAAVRRVQYFKGRTLEELKATTANDAGIWPDSREGMLDTRAFYAGKTASNGTDRFIWGWCPTRPGNDNTNVGAYPAEPEWAGTLVAHRLIQHEDGSLSLGAINAIKEKFSRQAPVTVMDKAGNVNGAGSDFSLDGDAHILFSRLSDCNKIEFTVTTSADNDKFGISFVRGIDSEKYYTMVVNPEGNGKRKINFEQEGPEGAGFIAGADGYNFDIPADNIYKITIINDNSVCTMYINDNVAYTSRVYGIQKNCWSINSYGGGIKVSDLKISQLDR